MYPRFQMFARNTTVRPVAIRRSGAIAIALSCHAPSSMPYCHTAE